MKEFFYKICLFEEKATKQFNLDVCEFNFRPHRKTNSLVLLLRFQKGDVVWRIEEYVVPRDFDNLDKIIELMWIKMERTLNASAGKEEG